MGEVLGGVVADLGAVGVLGEGGLISRPNSSFPGCVAPGSVGRVNVSVSSLVAKDGLRGGL